MQDVYGTVYTVTSQSEVAYSTVMLWAETAKAAESFDTREVQQTMYGRQFQTPVGVVEMTPSNYVSKPIRVGTLNARGTGLRVIAGNDAAIEPEPFWLYPTRSATECKFKELLPSDCVAGQYYSQEDKDCIFCPVGHRELEGVCLECEPGKAAEIVGQTECVRCEPGQIAETSGMSVCVDCAAGK